MTLILPQIGFEQWTSHTLLNKIQGYWKFDEASGTAFADATGQNPNGTAVNTTWGTGIIGSCLSFSGSTSYASVPASSYSQFTGDFSISAWINVTSFTTLNCPIIGNYTDSNPWPGFLLFATASTYKILTGSFGGAPTTGSWVHLVVSLTGSTCTPYINNVPQTPITGVSNTNYGSTGFYIGRLSSLAGGWSFNGLIDEVGVWSRGVTANEVATLYNGGAGKQYPF